MASISGLSPTCGRRARAHRDRQATHPPARSPTRSRPFIDPWQGLLGVERMGSYRSESENVVSHRGSLLAVQEVPANETKVLHHLMPENPALGWSWKYSASFSPL